MIGPSASRGGPGWSGRKKSPESGGSGRIRRPGMNKIRTFAELLQAEAEEMLHSATRSSSPRFAAQDHRSGSEIDEWA